MSRLHVLNFVIILPCNIGVGIYKYFVLSRPLLYWFKIFEKLETLHKIFLTGETPYNSILR